MKTIACAVVWIFALTCVGPLVAQTSSERRVVELTAQALEQVGPSPEGRQVELMLDDAIARALDRNLDIAVERLNPQVFDLTIAQQLAVYRPTFSMNFLNTSRKTPSSTQLDGGQSVQTDTSTYDASVTQPVQWGGGDLSVGWNNNRTETTNTFSSFNPSFRSVFAATYTQPLLRGFRIDNNRQQLHVTRINRDISEVDLRQTITNIMADVRSAYWDLAYSVATVDVQQQALDLAEQLVRDNQIRVEIGTLAPLDVIQAQSEAAARRQTLAQAEQNLQTAELLLKRLIVDGTEDDLWSAELRPVDQPIVTQGPINLEAAVRISLDQRTDLSRARRQQDINRLNVRLLRNNTLPALDLLGTYQLQGQGGTRFLRTGLGGNVTTVIPGGFTDAAGQIAGADFPTWTIQLQLSYPIGNSSADAALERARLQVRQTEAQVAQIELQVATEVTNAGLQIGSIQRRIEAARAARELTEEQLAAEISKFEVGMSTNFFVVQAQRDLATAQDTELRALLDYQKAVIEFERVQQTSLSRAGISIVGGGG